MRPALVHFLLGRVARPRSKGFTLLEMIVTLVIAGIVAGMVAMFIVKPIQGYIDLGRRAALVDAAESALRRMARDLRLALPNSVRVTNSANGFALELLPIIDGGKYTTAGANDIRLNVQGNFDTDFDNFGCFHAITPSSTPYTNFRIVINNLGTLGFDAYAGTTINALGNTTGVITPAGLGITITNNAGANCPTTGDQHIRFSAAHAFLDLSPHQRFYVIDKPISYLCDQTSGTLTRYANYPIQASQPATAAVLNGLAGVTSALVTGSVTACSITSTSTNVRDRGLATLALTLSKDGETIRLIHQVQLDNSR